MQDQVIVSAILGSCSESIQSLISMVAFAHDAWSRLSNTYARTTPGRVLFLKAKLAQNPKGSRTITKYLKDMSDIVDALALAGQPVSDSDIVASIITQLGDNYRSVYSTLHVRETTVTQADLFDILLNIERLITTSSDSPPLLPTANQTQVKSASYSGQSQQSYGNQRSGRGNRGRGGRFGGLTSYNQSSQDNYFHGQPASECQYCHYAGHTARVCRKLARFL